MIHTTIQPTDVFDREGLQQALGREVRKGRLKAYRRAKKDYFLVSYVLSWIKDGEVNGNGEEQC